MNRVKHNLWKVSNGWLLVPEGVDGMLSANEASNCAVFKTLDEFAKWTPTRKRIRKPKTKPQTTKETTNANQH